MKVLAKGFVESVFYRSGDKAEVWANGSGFLNVPWAEADKALSAQRSVPPQQIEVFGDGPYATTRTIRIVPSLVIRARGKVRSVTLADREDNARAVIHVGGPQYYSVYGEDNARAAALAMHGDFDVEIVSVDGGPDTVRLP